MQQFDPGQAPDIPRAFIEQFRRAHRYQQLGKQPGHFPIRWKVTIAQQHGAIEGLVVEVHMVDIHPGTGELHLITRLQVTKATEPGQQPAHGQGRGSFHAQDVVFAAQGVASPLQRGEPFANTRQQQPGSFAQLQATTIAHKQTAGEVLFKGADMPADRTLGNR
ncbi:hypothetical protein D3C77_344300 [compost metagenome]